MTMPYRTLISVFLLGSCLTFLPAAMNSTESYIYKEHPTNHSSIIDVLTKDDIFLGGNSSLVLQNARETSSDVKEETKVHKDHAELLEMVRKQVNVDHDSHMDHMDHGSHMHHMDHDSHMHHERTMMRDQAPVRGNDLRKAATDHKDHDHGDPKSQDQVEHSESHDDMNHKDHDNMDHMDHKDHDNMDHKDHDNMDHKDHDNMDHKDHDNMDRDGMHMHMNGSDMHGMMMWFHAGISEVILFKEWKVTTVGGMIGSVIGIILLGMLYEGLKYYREYLFKQYISSMQFATVAVTGESGRVTQVHKVEKHRMLSVAHAIQTFLHVLQIVLSYFLMLIFMTYNVWLCLAVVIGAGVGYFIFGWKKATVVDITEHCH